MMQFMNNIWIALSSENPGLVNILLIPCGIIEVLCLTNLTLTIFKLKTNKLQKLHFIMYICLFCLLNQFFIPSPYNVVLNYVSVILLIKITLKLDILKSSLSLIVSIFIFGLINILIQNPYLDFCNISLSTFMNTAIYRIPYLIMLYIFIYIICLFIKRFNNSNFTLDSLDILDKRTKIILFFNLFIGFLTLCIQLIITAFYIDIVPVIITFLSFILLVAFLILSIYSFTRIIMLSLAKRDLQNAEDYNKSLEILYDEVSGFKHDFDNIIKTFKGYLADKDLESSQSYLKDIEKEYKIAQDLALLNPRSINNPGIYSLLNNKYFTALDFGIDMSFKFFIDFNNIKIDTYRFSRIIGILIDNAIEAAKLCKEKIVNVSFIREENFKRDLIIIKNTYSNKNIDIDKIFTKGFSEKENHLGIGLSEVQKYINNIQNISLKTSKNDKYFIQQFEIYDEVKNIF